MKSVNWQSPLVVRRFKSPTGPLAEADNGCYVMDFTKQRAIVPEPIGSRDDNDFTMNAGGSASHAILTTPDTHGTESPFGFPK
jgi:hypothetical protein